MKVSVTSIIKAHLLTLRNFGSARASRIDIFLFYGLPIVIGVAIYAMRVKLSEDVYSVSISVFSIFSALLFSVQVAMYGVFRSGREKTGDKILDAEDRKTAEDVRGLLREINANVSYLILVSCTAVTVFLIFFATPVPSNIESSVLIGLYLHFLLTVAMVLKRAHEVFDAEYAKPLQFRD